MPKRLRQHHDVPATAPDRETLTIAADEMGEITPEMMGILEEIMPLSFESPESSSIRGAWYDPGSQQLHITFQYGDHPTYRYSSVEPALWREFLESKSRGKFMATRIRPLYTGVRV